LISQFKLHLTCVFDSKLLTSLLESNTHVKWSLNCDINNEAALKLYKKVGFISDGQIELYKHMYHHLIVK
ncbi:hypothetical protein ACFKKD_00455, partial [Streptococcus agalactiae]